MRHEPVLINEPGNKKLLSKRKTKMGTKEGPE
jgi:hypothetical protein